MDFIINITLRFRFFTLLLSLLLVGLAAYGAKYLQFDPDLRSLYDPDHPIMLELGDVESEFTKRDSALIVVSVEQGDVFRPDVLALIQQLTAAAWEIPYVSRVDSITNFQYTEADGDDLYIADLVPLEAVNNEGKIAKAREAALSHSALVPLMLSNDGAVTTVNASFMARDQREIAQHMPEFMGALESLVESHQGQVEGVKLQLSGAQSFSYAMAKYASNDTATLIPLMMLLMLVLLYVMIRSIYATFCAAVVVLATTIATMGIGGWLGFSLEIVSIISPIVVMTLAVADAVHLINGVSQGRSQGLAKFDSIAYGLRLNTLPIIITSVTTVLGVITFSFTDFPPLRKLGVLIAVGVSIAALLSITLLPALLTLRELAAREINSSTFFQRLAAFVCARYKSILWFALPLVALGFALVPLNQLDESPKIFFERTTPERQTIEFLEGRLSGIVPIDIVIDSGEENGIYNPEFLHAADQFSDWIRAREGIGHVTSVVDTLKRLNKNMHADDEAFYRVPESRELVAQYLLLYELSLPVGLELTHQVNLDKSAILISVVKPSGSARASVETKEAAHAWIAQHAPQYGLQVTGMSQTSSELAYTFLIPSMLKGGSIAILTVSLVLLLALRSVRLGLIGMVANVVPIAVGYGIWAIYSGMMGFAVASVVGICLGVVVDFAVHFLSKYRVSRLQGETVEQAVCYAYGTVGRAIWITTLVLVSGFWVLVLSEIGLNSDLGLLTGLVILLASLFTLLVMPALLLLVDRR